MTSKSQDGMIFESAPLCHNNHNNHKIDHNYPWSEDRAGTGQFNNTEAIIFNEIFGRNIGYCLVIRKETFLLNIIQY